MSTGALARARARALKPFEFFGRTHAATIGIDVGGDRARAGDPFEGRIGELVGGIPARVWDYSGWQTPSRWSRSTFAAYAGDQVEISERLLLSGGLRFERVTGEAAGAAQGCVMAQPVPACFGSMGADGVADGSPCFRGSADTDTPCHCAGWRSVIRQRPWRRFTDGSRQAVFGHRSQSEIGSLVARVGPGTGGDPRFSTIESGLERPRFDELIVGVESRRGASTIIRLAGVGRWEQQSVALTNPGVPDDKLFDHLRSPTAASAGLDLILPAIQPQSVDIRSGSLRVDESRRGWRRRCSVLTSRCRPGPSDCSCWPAELPGTSRGFRPTAVFS